MLGIGASSSLVRTHLREIGNKQIERGNQPL